jgi:hypothetical protein
MTPISYDFVRANSPTVHSRLAGFTSETWGYTVNSELLPGFDFNSSYSLFQGSALSDTAKFKPYLTGISASFNISRAQNPFLVIARLFGFAAPEAQATPIPATGLPPSPDGAMARTIAAQQAGETCGVAAGSSLRQPRDGARPSVSSGRAPAHRSAPTSSSSIHGRAASRILVRGRSCSTRASRSSASSQRRTLR